MTLYEHICIIEYIHKISIHNESALGVKMVLENKSTEDIIVQFGENKSNTGKTEVQIALLTKKINNLSSHLQKYKKDCHNRHALLTIVGKRKRLLKYLRISNLDAYRDVINKLALRH